jgi:two-component system NtrC family sensor kinase
MRQRDKSAGKRQRPKTLKRRNAPKTARQRNSVAAKETNVARLSRELSEAFEQQAATADILNIISNSPTDTQPVFDAIVQSGLKLFPDALISLALRYGNTINAAAIAEPDPEGAEAWRRSISRTPLSREYMHGAAMLDCKIVDIPDVRNAPAELATGARNFLTSGYRAITITPMMRRNEAIGLLSVVRRTPGPLSDKQLSLLRTFAAQAVIAIENARLMNELRQRTDDLSESLEQQTATSEVLKVISSSASDLQPVFDTMAENVVRLCDAERAYIFRFDGELLRAVATYNVGPENREFVNHNPIAPGRHSVSARAALERRSVQVPDVQADPEFAYAIRDVDPIRTVLAVPMLKSDDLVGTVTIYRLEVKPFTDKQVTLVETFAAQAVIAIENTRLLSELRESLEQQTATSEVLKVISSSPGELEPVFNAMLANATRICEANYGNLFLREGNIFRAVAVHSKEGHVDLRRNPVLDLRDNPGTPIDRVATTKQVVHIHDLRTDQSYIGKNNRIVPLVEVGGARTLATVPMLKEGELIGAITLYRQEVRPFTDTQIELVQNFGAQAVIAIENTRLLNELRQRTDDLTETLEQQTATSEVLRVISSSPTNVQPVFDAIAESAVRLCDGQFSFVLRFDGKVMDFASCCGLSAEGLDAFHSILPMPASEDTASGRAVVRRAVVEIPDVEADLSYGAQGQGLAKAVTYRSIAAVPLLHEGNPIGAIAVARANAGSFPKRQIALLQAFADQAVIAIANVRLFDEVQARTRELAKSLDDLRTTQDRLVQTQKLASLGQLTAGIAHEIKNPLNFVNNFSGLSSELIDELQEALGDVSLIEKRHSEITELMDTLRGNLDKVIQHGKRADAIVKNMLQHSREGSGEHGSVDINALVEECLSLAWHGARAEKQGFAITRKQSFDPSAGQVDIFSQDITRALLNLISNGFYAATKRNTETNGGDYEPTLTASTRNLGDRVEIRIRDNGTGIPPDVKEKMFNPFFTTKPTGEGTGLGLSISHDIIVKQHAGSIDVDTQPGEFTEIIVTLPRAAVFV